MVLHKVEETNRIKQSINKFPYHGIVIEANRN